MTTKSKRTRDELVAELSDARQRQQDALADAAAARINGGSAGKKLTDQIKSAESDVAELEAAIVVVDHKADEDAADQVEKQAHENRIALIEWATNYAGFMNQVHLARVELEQSEAALLQTLSLCPRRNLFVNGVERYINPENGFREDRGVADTDMPDVVSSLPKPEPPRPRPRDWQWSDERNEEVQRQLADLLAMEQESVA